MLQSVGLKKSQTLERLNNNTSGLAVPTSLNLIDS